MRCTLGVEPKEVGVLRHEYAVRSSGKAELLVVANGRQTNFSGTGHINATTAQASSNAERDMLVQVKADAHN